jgi:glutathione S-transferase
MFGAKAQIAALEKGLRFDPKRQVPVLVHGDLEIFDSTQIFEYLEDLQPTPALWPQTPAARARARLLEHRSDEVYFPPIIHLMGLQNNLQAPEAMAAIEASTRYYAKMETLLVDSDWLAGTYSFADIAFYMAALFGERQSAPINTDTPRLLAWRVRMTRRPAVREVAGAIARWLADAGRPVPAFLT